MAKAKTRPTKEYLSATERDAEAALGSHTRKHADYSRESYTERDKGGGMMDGARMRRDAPVKAIESLMKPNAKRTKEIITQTMLAAAWAFDETVNDAYGSMSHELRPFHDKSRSTTTVGAKQSHAIRVLSAIENRMAPNMWAYTRTIFIYEPDKAIGQIFNSAHKRRLASDAIADLLDWLAVEYGLKQRTNKNTLDSLDVYHEIG